jgi:two-component system, chemotaxis family, chemotaxis protein CheY
MMGWANLRYRSPSAYLSIPSRLKWIAMGKRILLVGHCGPDTSYLKIAVRAAAPDATIQSVNDHAHLDRALAEGVDLMLLNRELDGTFGPSCGADASGVDLIRRLKEQHPSVKFLLVSNYPDAQAAALAAGASPGFGKRDLGSAKAVESIKAALKLEDKKTSTN